ncbi:MULTISPECIES: Rpn family recombination-promoting nuclease/putative transposase [Clostridium]|uniref:Rpn family recombination-promoting nuclease/putative transposase n=1 Tax=Clostridium TaxID=1485 RepID=UPI0013E8F8C0|nr:MULTISPECIES: Rpn family recombination-promoting nuclease/putative transposase [Clostridium]MBW9158414.1 Rpn family recombination-promoting nuclease/putative transposase [Clostridium tagluense]MBZ9622630.1 Rpn family recombination-promoting nuclease/putative transposase [Clostridium sp. FP2]MBZ9634171.1 Rpn family recombination-promoting nuclease/putative transposase [Clostridium sp. FP1]WLC66906.1 Rpn family recombination-promoting nuclease/putative transposase [Clostridium tagluense]
MCRLNPKIDLVFKKLFGSEENKDILIAFINSVLSEDQQIVNVELRNPYNIASYFKGKMSTIDIKAVDEDGKWYDIEMQIAEQGAYDKRAFYYWSKAFSEQIESGEQYAELKKTIGIHILDFNLEQLECEEDYHSTIKPYIEKSKNQFSDLFELHFIELNKFKKDYNEIKTAMDRWTAFLSKAHQFDKEHIPKELAEDKAVKKAVEQLDIMYMSKEEREVYEYERKARMNYKEEMRTVLENQKVEIARNLLDVLSDEIISNKTGLTIEKIRKLRKELAN